ncbi:MAG: hypothetical protein GX428_08880 [Candidatus Atribacteria bacterium]|nr:hypothetical protein [Candidatus Atribacteria bacterium]
MYYARSSYNVATCHAMAIRGFSSTSSAVYRQDGFPLNRDKGTSLINNIKIISKNLLKNEVSCNG